ncbi:pilus assembly protein N-terminal domain-containing protein [Vulgatibacter sp.]|uniref:pilus assembly protein N-terminal domain-containing protein n=1 Tax=Vulgatibacter sp. TaxID=1971226 RepID=UPI003561ED06
MGRYAAGLLLVVAIALPAAASAEEILLGVGAQRVLTAPGGIERISVGDPEIADVKPLGSDQVLVLAGKPGRTTLLVWRKGGRRDSHAVVVRHGTLDHTVDEIRALLADREGISVRSVGDRILLEGDALTAEDHRRVEQVVGLYPGVRSFVRVAPAARRVVAQHLTAAFAEAGLPGVRALVVGSTTFLEGTVESEAELEKAALIARALGERVENLVQVGLRRMVLSEVHFVELRRASLLNLGVKLPVEAVGTAQASATLTGPLAMAHGATAGTWDASAAAAAGFSLRAALDSGEGRLLAQPKLVCASGESAEFLAGGEVPLPLVTANSSAVDYKPYGIVLRIKPIADRDGNISTEIEAEVSELDRSVAVAVGPDNSVPGFRNRRVRTRVTVKSGETIVLSGVFSRDEQKNVSKVPVLGHIPILGELFKQRAVDDVERELVVFVTPRLVAAGDEASDSLIGDLKRRYEEENVGVELLD